MMEIADEITIPAPRAVVYEALNDIAILKACIPGCESLERESDTKLVAKVTLKIGPVKAKFNGTVMLDQSKAPDGFSLSGEGEGGLAGFAKGGADVTLTEDGETTILQYERKSGNRRQDRPAWRPPDYQHGQKTVQEFLREIRKSHDW